MTLLFIVVVASVISMVKLVSGYQSYINKEMIISGENTQPETWLGEESTILRSEVKLNNNDAESGEKTLADTKFGYNVEVEDTNREVPLTEEDFKQLRKGQYITSEKAECFEAEYSVGIVEMIGMFDGQILHSHRSPGTGFASTTPYYILDENTYVLLCFKNDDIISSPLDHIEVWDADGNKLRDIEIE